MLSRGEQDGKETADSIVDGRSDDIVVGTIAGVVSDGMMIFATAGFHGESDAGWSANATETILPESVITMMGITVAVSAAGSRTERIDIDVTSMLTGAIGS